MCLVGFDYAEEENDRAAAADDGDDDNARREDLHVDFDDLMDLGIPGQLYACCVRPSIVATNEHARPRHFHHDTARYTIHDTQPITTATTTTADTNLSHSLVGFRDSESEPDTGSVGSIRSGSWAAWSRIDSLYSEMHSAQRYLRRGQAFDSDESAREREMDLFVRWRAQARWRILVIRIRFLMLMRRNARCRAAEGKWFVNPPPFPPTQLRFTTDCVSPQSPIPPPPIPNPAPDFHHPDRVLL